MFGCCVINELVTTVVIYRLCDGVLRGKPAIAGIQEAAIAKNMRFAVAITIAVFKAHEH